MRSCELREPGRIEYGQALDLQQRLVEQRKHGLVPDQLLLLEHPHTITLGRNGRLENLLASEPALLSAGISFHATDRGGDITYHGPGQVVGYPILDLREWRRDRRRFAVPRRRRSTSGGGAGGRRMTRRPGRRADLRAAAQAAADDAADRVMRMTKERAGAAEEIRRARDHHWVGVHAVALREPGFTHVFQPT